MSFESLNRKLARCAREIAEAKPLVLSLDDFRFLNHDIKEAPKRIVIKAPIYFKRDETEPPLPISKPPHRFAVGDRVRTIVKAKERGECVVTRIDGDAIHYTTSSGKPDWSFSCWLEPLPPEPKAEADGWIEWKGGERPVSCDVSIEIRQRGGRSETGRASCWKACWLHTYPASHDIIAYRVLA